MGGRKREKEETQLRSGPKEEGRGSEVYSTVHEYNVQRVFTQPDCGLGIESSKIRETPGRHLHPGYDRQRKKASEPIIGEGKDAEGRMISSE